MDEEERQALIEELASAWRPRLDGRVEAHPAWGKLDPEGRREAFDLAMILRKMEAALDPDEESTTGKAVLAEISQMESGKTGSANVTSGRDADVEEPPRGKVLTFRQRIFRSQPLAVAAVALFVVGIGVWLGRSPEQPGAPDDWVASYSRDLWEPREPKDATPTQPNVPTEETEAAVGKPTAPRLTQPQQEICGTLLEAEARLAKKALEPGPEFTLAVGRCLQLLDDENGARAAFEKAAALIDCGQMSRTACMNSRLCRLEAVDERGLYRCVPGDACERSHPQGELRSGDERARCEKHEGCLLEPGRCYCDCKGYGRTAVEDGDEAKSCECECGGGPPPTCRRDTSGGDPP